jgi:hypothetical protein
MAEASKMYEKFKLYPKCRDIDQYRSIFEIGGFHVGVMKLPQNIVPFFDINSVQIEELEQEYNEHRVFVCYKP